jgi:putative aldouronate transport system substrate-binding protein
MKKVGRNFASTFVSLLLIAAVLEGCGASTDNKKGEAAPTSTSSAASSSPKAAPVSIKMFNRVNAGIVLENNPVIAEVEKLANVKLSIEAPPINNYVDKLQVLMASGDLPDLVYNRAALTPIWKLGPKTVF